MIKKRFMFMSTGAMAIFLAACQNSPSSHPKLSGAGMDMFTPVKVRLHPLSRIVPPNNATPGSVESRIEFTDQFGDIGKGVGAMSFELFAYETLGINNKGASLDKWTADISTPENQSAWDAITQTYLLKHAVSAAALGKHEKVVLAVTVTLPNGQKLRDNLTIPVK